MVQEIYFSFKGDLVTATPDVYQLALGSDAEFVLLASDGLGDYMNSSDAATFVRNQLREHGNVQKACEALAEVALDRRSQDNVSIVIADLGKSDWHSLPSQQHNFVFELSQAFATIALNGDVGVSERSKKDKDRGSRVNLSSQMGGGWSEGEREGDEELPLSSPPRNKNSTKKFRLQSKSLKGSNEIAPANVPRRLRSAMNKRTQESLSPPLHHTSTGMVQSRINNGKKLKGNMVTIPMIITKDEEEVAEALFSLARMSPNNESNAEEQTSEEKRSLLQETIISPTLSAEAPKDKNILSQHASSAIKAIDISSSLEGSAAEAEKRSSLSESIGTDRSNAAGYPKLDLSLQSSMSLEDRAKISRPSTIAHSNDIPSHAASMMGVSAQFSHGTGSVQLANLDSSLREQMLENGPRPVVNALRKEVQHSINGKKEQPTLRAHGEDPSLSPGMSMEASRGSEVHVPSSSIRSFPTKTPAWLDSAASATRPGSSKANVSTEKVHPVLVERRQPRKRCVSHAYISHLIQAYQTAEKTPVPPTPLKPNEETKFGAPITNNLSEFRNGPNRFVCMGSVNNPKGYVAIDSNSSSVQGKAVNDVQVGTTQGKMLQNDHLSSITSGTLSDKQKYDFLSLSTGGDGSSEPVATTANKNQGGMGMESSSQAHSPYLYPFLQHHPPMPYSLPHVRYPSSQQLQLSQYATSPMYCPPHPGHAGLSKLQQQQHQMWAAHQAAVQYRPGGMAESPFPKWQNGRYESPSLPSCSKSSYPSSSSPLDVLGMKFSPGPQQQNIFSLPPSSSRGKRQHHYISSSFNEGSSSVLL